MHTKLEIMLVRKDIEEGVLLIEVMESRNYVAIFVMRVEEFAAVSSSIVCASSMNTNQLSSS